MIMNLISGGVTSPKGFKAAGAEAGIKYKDRMDMALVYSEVLAKVAGTFTTNVVKAAPVLWDMDIVENYKTAQAVVLNSGIANACTSREGERINQKMAGAVAESLNIPINTVLTASTGVIGMQIPLDRVYIGVEKLVKGLGHGEENGTRAAQAIMTTDTVKKECAVTFSIGGKEITIGGMSKGSGMIHPNMATMLSVVTTDINISGELLKKAVKADVEDSFNMISVDRDTSTNDTFLVLANGLAGNAEITTEGEDYAVFCQALSLVTKTLAKTMAGDGEGATKLFETRVIHCKTKKDARLLAKSVITSNLVKTALYGSDANWGRILCALGYSGAEFDPENVDLYIEGNGKKLKLFEKGRAADYSEAEASSILSASEVCATADMNSGREEAAAWGCDLTYDYVKINGDYRS